VSIFRALKIIFAPVARPLIQLAAALGIVISLGFVLLGFVGGSPRDRNRTRYRIGSWHVQALAKEVERYRTDCGEYPSTRDGLNALVVDPGVDGWHGPYLENGVPLDPWRRPYIYLLSSDSTPEILSYGADGKPGGEFFDTDISSRRPWHSIPESPYEVRARRLWIGIWIGAWFGLIGSVLVFIRTVRPPKG
jgi:general secretion pathway protein G